MQIVRGVAKYLYHHNKDVKERQLNIGPIEGYLKSVSTGGMGPSAIAVRFLRLTVSCRIHHSVAICKTVLPHRLKMMRNLGGPAGESTIPPSPLMRISTERRPRSAGTSYWKEPWKVGLTLWRQFKSSEKTLPLRPSSEKTPPPSSRGTLARVGITPAWVYLLHVSCTCKFLCCNSLPLSYRTVFARM